MGSPECGRQTKPGSAVSARDLTGDYELNGDFLVGQETIAGHLADPGHRLELGLDHPQFRTLGCDDVGEGGLVFLSDLDPHRLEAHPGLVVFMGKRSGTVLVSGGAA